MAISKEVLYESYIKNIAGKIANAQRLNGHEIIAIRHVKRDESVSLISGSYNEIFAVTMRVEETRKINILLRVALDNGEICESLPVYTIIEIEIYFYTKIYPALAKFVNRVTNSNFNESNLVADYYLHSLKSQDYFTKWLAIQNLEADNFHVVDSREDLTCEHFTLIFRSYAYFTAHSYLLKERNPEKFNDIVSPLPNIVNTIIRSSRFSQNFRTMRSTIRKFLKPGQDDPLISYFEEYIKKGKKLLIKLTKKTGKYDTVIHGNLWTNHVLFRSDPETEQPVDLRFIDWKHVMYGNPVYDLSFCLYSGAPKSVLDNFVHYLMVYYESLKSNLLDFNCDIYEHYTYKRFLREWKTYSKCGFLMAIQVIFLKCSAIDNQADDASSNPQIKLLKTLKYDKKKLEMKIRDLLNHMLKVENL